MAPPSLPDLDIDGPPVEDLSPEGRRKAALRHIALHEQVRVAMGPGTRFFEVLKRVIVGTYNDGFIHAGNLAYMTVLAIFPFFITGAAIFSAIGEPSERAATIDAILFALPPVVGDVIGPVARKVIEQRSGWLLAAAARDKLRLWRRGCPWWPSGRRRVSCPGPPSPACETLLAGGPPRAITVGIPGRDWV